MKKVFLTVTILGLLQAVSEAQDPNFSQFFASPLTLNPAMTGKFDGIFRVAGNFRNQWPTINNAFETKTASFDAGILKNRIPEFDQFGVGFLGFTDRAGGGVLVNNSIGASVAYHKALDENGYHQLGAGFQGVFVNKRLDPGKVVFEDELRANGFVPGTTQEIFLNNRLNLSYFDLNAGIFYNGSTNGYNNYYLGASLYHITRPEESHIQELPNDVRFLINPRLTIQAGGKLPAGQYNAFHFSGNFSTQANARNIVIGGAYAMNLNFDESNPTNLYLGSWFRFQDALIPYIGLEFGDLHVGLTYDLNVSGLKTASNYRGGIELSLIYIKQPVDRSLKKLNCPKF